jgi:hypothetical protein
VSLGAANFIFEQTFNNPETIDGAPGFDATTDTAIVLATTAATALNKTGNTKDKNQYTMPNTKDLQFGGP